MSKFEIHVQCFISLSENRKPNQGVGIASHRPCCSCNSANRLWKELDYEVFYLAKLFASNPNA